MRHKISKMIVASVVVGLSFSTINTAPMPVMCDQESGLSAKQVGEQFGLGDLCKQWQGDDMMYACCDCVVKKGSCSVRKGMVQSGCDSKQMFNMMLKNMTAEQIEDGLNKISNSLGDAISWNKMHCGACFVSAAHKVIDGELAVLHEMAPVEEEMERPEPPPAPRAMPVSVGGPAAMPPLPPQRSR